MSNVLRAFWDNTYGLLVDDGQMAVGIVVALALTWALATYVGGSARADGGWVLLVLVVALTFANLYRAGKNAKRRAVRRSA